VSGEDSALALLDPAAAAAFEALTFPAYRHLLRLERAPRHAGTTQLALITPVAVGLRLGGAPAGLALAELKDGGAAELLSVFVDTAIRGRGVAGRLLAALEEELVRRGASSLQAVYMTGQPSQGAVERVLEKAGFDPPAARMLSVRIRVEDLRRTRWYRRIPLESGLEIFPWADLGADEREGLRVEQAASGWIPSHLEPWKHDADGFERRSSVGVRRGREVVGWVINHEISESVVRFTSSYLRRGVGTRGRLMPVFSESIRRLSGTPYETATFTVPVAHAGMVSFTRRWIEPHASFLGETRGARKRLGLSPLTLPEGGC
jgi:GNAT superfamily N-acetyltransferase